MSTRPLTAGDVHAGVYLADTKRNRLFRVMDVMTETSGLHRVDCVMLEDAVTLAIERWDMREVLRLRLTTPARDAA